MKKHVKKSTLGVLAAAVLLVGACAPKEKTLIVPELLKDIPLLIKTTAWCNENPGERIALPNCVNAAQASYAARAGAFHDELLRDGTPEGMRKKGEEMRGKI